ncbi:cyclic AMP-dependent transcription factor ATF-4 isoform X2 [Genypterus blacodes]|uniref:cyclic AMP-dependent transcription factor ATF-4 isoform X2 n=1 Tax=Genypterus blacodes TaxID=154954 RepID=UPI003F75D6B9
MTLSPLALEDMEALYLGSSLLMADPMGPLLDQDEEEALSPSFLEEKAPSLSSYAPPLSPYQTMLSSPFSSPPSPPSHHTLMGTKAGAAQLTPPWLGANDLLTSDAGADDGKEDAFSGMDWMSEKIDLSDFDLDSLIGSCASDDSPSSPEDLLASLDSHMDLDLDSFDAPIPAPDHAPALSLPDEAPLPLELPVPMAEESRVSEVAPEQEVVLKSEPLSPAPSPPPPSPGSTLELGSEVDVPDAERNAPALPATVVPDPTVPSLPIAGHFVVVLTQKDEPSLAPIPDPVITASPLPSDSESDSGIDSEASSPPRLPSPPPTPSPSAGSSRTKPYAKPEPISTFPPMAKASRLKSVSGAPKVVEKKLKKMEQNKTAATRYRQKKRVEQELISSECDDLEKRNCELAEKAESISREIQYLKDLMEEVRKRRSKTVSVA